MDYLKLFQTHQEYEAFVSGGTMLRPNVSHCVADNDVHYNPIVSETRLIVIYNVTDDSNPTMLYGYYTGEEGEEAPEELQITGVKMFDAIEIDGVDVSVETLDSEQGAYQLSSGTHTVKYTLKDPTYIGIEWGDDSIVRLGAVFSRFQSVVSVTIPTSVTTIDGGAFNECEGLTSVTMGSGVTSIEDYSFADCSSLTSIEIPNSVTSIGGYAFYGCVSLTSITIPSGVTSIEDYSFADCSSLTSINIPSGVTYIGYNTFERCGSITSITIPSGVTAIYHSAFSECSSLTSITIPSGVTSIGNSAFWACSGLTSITINATTPPTLPSNSLPFNNGNECPIYVPSESVNTYKTAANWGTYASRIQAIP